MLIKGMLDSNLTKGKNNIDSEYSECCTPIYSECCQNMHVFVECSIVLKC
uniref:Uncharacterized protein n=1 Tax=Arundo donax TaxID=35708 RepID=A0A0A9B2F8_ARUDO